MGALSSIPLWVFSTYVEVILISGAGGSATYGILHVCGGDPNSTMARTNQLLYSPRMWRWSYCYHYPVQSHQVFSTYVEVILLARWKSFNYRSILHVCGGDPIVVVVGNGNHGVFSTYVEVILTDLVGAVLDWGILHTCWECYCPWAHR